MDREAVQAIEEGMVHYAEDLEDQWETLSNQYSERLEEILADEEASDAQYEFIRELEDFLEWEYFHDHYYGY